MVFSKIYSYHRGCCYLGSIPLQPRKNEAKDKVFLSLHDWFSQMILWFMEGKSRQEDCNGEGLGHTIDEAIYIGTETSWSVPS